MIRHLAEIGSTNDWLAQQAAMLPDGQWVRADVQTGGRGRRGRAWTTVPGNLFASVLVKPQAGEGPAPQLSFVAAVALASAMERWVAPARLTLKWPNDLLLDGVKCAGILLEGGQDTVIIGFGVNLAGHPAGTERPATSLPAVGIAAPGAGEVCAELAVRFGVERARWRENGFAPIRAAWLERATGLGARIEARLGAETLTGVFDSLGEDGALMLRLDEGAIRAVHAGEVFAL